MSGNRSGEKKGWTFDPKSGMQLNNGKYSGLLHTSQFLDQFWHRFDSWFPVNQKRQIYDCIAGQILVFDKERIFVFRNVYTINGKRYFRDSPRMEIAAFRKGQKEPLWSRPVITLMAKMNECGNTGGRVAKSMKK